MLHCIYASVDVTYWGHVTNFRRVKLARFVRTEEETENESQRKMSQPFQAADIRVQIYSTVFCTFILPKFGSDRIRFL